MPHETALDGLKAVWQGLRMIIGGLVVFLCCTIQNILTSVAWLILQMFKKWRLVVAIVAGTVIGWTLPYVMATAMILASWR